MKIKIITKKKSIGLSAVVVLLTIMSCDVADSEKEWGVSLVYMPQAVLHSGGADNNYYVPSSTNEWDQNYHVEDDIISVVLGVYRSGLESFSAFSVDVVVKPDIVDQLIGDGIISNAAHLPDEAYNLPSNVSVSSDDRESIFYLEIDRAKLLEDYPDVSDNNLVLAVAIENPSQYELNHELSTTIVIISDEWPTLDNIESEFQ